MQKDSLEIADLLVLREISHPVRKAILNCILNEALSAREISQVIDFPYEKIYYHIKKLSALELIVVAESEVINGITKKKYMAAAKSIKIGSTVDDLNQEGTSPSDESEPEKESLEPVEETLIEETTPAEDEPALEPIDPVETEIDDPLVEPDNDDETVETEVSNVPQKDEPEPVTVDVETEPSTVQDDNSLIAKLMKGKVEPEPTEPDLETSIPTDEEPSVELTSSVLIDNIKYLLPETDLTPEGIEQAVSNAQREDRKLMSIEEMSALKNHLLSQRAAEEQIERSISSVSKDKTIDTGEIKSTLSRPSEFSIYLFRLLNGYFRTMTFVKKRERVTFLKTRIGLKGYRVEEAETFHLPMEVDEGTVATMPELIMHIYRKKIKPKLWRNYYLAYYNDDYPSEIEFFQAPRLKKSEMDQFVKLQIGQKYPIDQEKTIFDWMISKKGKKSEGDEVMDSASCIFVDEAPIYNEYTSLTENGLTPRYATSIAKIQGDIFKYGFTESTSGDAILLHLGYKTLNITLMKDWEIVETRESILGLDAFCQTLMDASSPSGNISKERALELLFSQPLPVRIRGKWDPPPIKKRYIYHHYTRVERRGELEPNYGKMVSSVYQKFISEIELTLRHFRKKGYNIHANVFMGGPGTNIPDILPLMAISLERKIKKLQFPEERISVRKGNGNALPETFEDYSANFGLLLDPWDRLSLMPEEQKKSFKYFLPTRLMRIGMASLLLVISSFTLIAYGDIIELKKNVPVVKRQVNAEVKKLESFYDLSKKIAAVGVLKSIYDYDTNHSERQMNLIIHLSRTLPQSISVSSIDSYTDPETNGVTISGVVNLPSGSSSVVYNNTLLIIKEIPLVKNATEVTRMVNPEGLLEFTIQIEI